MIHPIILKFGGTSVSSGKNVRTIEAIVQSTKGKNPVVVVSALSGVTDLLLSLGNTTPIEAKKILAMLYTKHKALIQELWHEKKSEAKMLSYIDKQLFDVAKLLRQQKRDRAWTDIVISHGEILSSYIISQWFLHSGIKSEQVIASNLIVTDTLFGNAEFLVEPTRQKARLILHPLINKGIVPVVTGFIGATLNGKITTFGRGGSDYSASILGFILDATEIQIWTDVNGVYTADPRIVSKAWQIPQISYAEASEMAYFGAKILHPRTILPATAKNIPVFVRNTLNPDHFGTRIDKAVVSSQGVTAVTSKKNVPLVSMYAAEMFLAHGFLSRVFAIFAKNNISIDLISASQVSISVTLDNKDGLENAIAEIEKFTKIHVIMNASVVSLIGEGIGKNQKILPFAFLLLEKNNISVKMVSFDAAHNSASFVMDGKHVENAVKILHHSMIEKKGNI